MLLGVLLGWSLRPQTEQRVLRFTHLTQVTSALGVEGYPGWSPDGRTLVYHSNQAGNWDIWMKQIGGGPAVNRTAEHTGGDRYPSFSPDGSWIAFASERTVEATS